MIRTTVHEPGAEYRNMDRQIAGHFKSRIVPFFCVGVFSSLVDIGLMYLLYHVAWGLVPVRSHVLVLLRDRRQLHREQVHHLPRHEPEDHHSVCDLCGDLGLLPDSQPRDCLAQRNLLFPYSYHSQDLCDLLCVSLELPRAEQVHVRDSGIGEPARFSHIENQMAYVD